MENAVTVAQLVQVLQAAWPDRQVEVESTHASWPDAAFLRLAIDKAWTALGWQPRFDLATSAAWTLDWYRAYVANADLRAVTDRQIAEYDALRPS